MRAGARGRLPHGPYLVVDVATCVTAGRSPADVVAAAVGAGVVVVQVRGKGLGSRELVEVTTSVCAAVEHVGRSAGVAVIVNDRVDVALAARARGADVAGVHLGQDDLAAHDARALLGPGAIVGISAARLGDVRAVCADADYVGAGPVRLTSTKPDAGPALGFGGLAAVVGTSAVPVVAIGGLGIDDVDAVRCAGAHGMAVVSALCAAPDVAAAASELVAAWSRHAARAL